MSTDRIRNASNSPKDKLATPEGVIAELKDRVTSGIEKLPQPVRAEALAQLKDHLEKPRNLLPAQSLNDLWKELLPSPTR